MSSTQNVHKTTATVFPVQGDLRNRRLPNSKHVLGHLFYVNFQDQGNQQVANIRNVADSVTNHWISYNTYTNIWKVYDKNYISVGRV